MEKEWDDLVERFVLRFRCGQLICPTELFTSCLFPDIDGTYVIELSTIHPTLLGQTLRMVFEATFSLGLEPVVYDVFLPRSYSHQIEIVEEAIWNLVTAEEDVRVAEALPEIVSAYRW